MLRAEEIAPKQAEPVAARATAAHDGYRWVPAAVFLSSILVTVTFWQILPSGFRVNEGTDYFAFYEPLARSLDAGHGLKLNGAPSITHPPGYPLILASIFKASRILGINEQHAMAAFAAGCMGIISVLIFYLARSLWGLRSAAIAGLLWLTYPFALWLTKQPNSELPFMVILYGGVLLFWSAVSRRINRPWVYGACGLIFGAGMLVRPFAIGLGVTMALVVWLARRDLARRARVLLMLALLAGNGLAILPWEIWAYANTGQIVLLGQGGAGGMRDGLTFGAERKNYRELNNYSSDVQQAMGSLQQRLAGTTTVGQVVAAAAAETQARPLAMAKLFLLKASRSWYGTDSLRKEGWILLVQLIYLIALFFCVRELWQRDLFPKAFATVVVALVIYFWAMSIVGLSLLRYTVPIVGLLFVLMSGAFSVARANHVSTARLDSE